MEEKSCKTCKYEDEASFDKPCVNCSVCNNFKYWEEKLKNKKRVYGMRCGEQRD